MHYATENEEAEEQLLNVIWVIEPRGRIDHAAAKVEDEVFQTRFCQTKDLAANSERGVFTI